MHLLYLDDSGSVANKSEDYVVLAGVSIFETQAYFLSKELDKIASAYDSDPNKVEFHASEIYSRRSHPWNTIKDGNAAKAVLKSVLKLVADSSTSTQIFACAVHKAFEDICQRFDNYLSAINGAGDKQKGLLILDESSYETTLQEKTKNFRINGTQYGNIKHLADIPFFVNSKASRIIQIADHIAYAIHRRYNLGDSQYFDIIAHRFFQSDGVIHGLAHKSKVSYDCMCIACFSRRNKF